MRESCGRRPASCRRFAKSVQSAPVYILRFELPHAALTSETRLSPARVLTAIAVRTRTAIGAARAYSMIILFSGGPIFFPKYSGVRPIMSPARKDGNRCGHDHAIQTRPEPAKDELSHQHIHQQNHAPECGEAVVHCAGGSCGGIGRYDGRSVVLPTPKRVSLPSMFPPGCDA